MKSKKYLDQYSLGCSNGFLYPYNESPTPPPFLKPKLTEWAIEYPNESEANLSSSWKSAENESLNKNPYKTNPINPSSPNKIKFLAFSVIALIIFYRSSDRLIISKSKIA